METKTDVNKYFPNVAYSNKRTKCKRMEDKFCTEHFTERMYMW